VADTRDAVLHLVDKYQDPRPRIACSELTWTHSQVVLRQLNATEADSQLYSRLASSVIYANASLRAPASVMVRNRRGQSGLWGYAISGDLPIVLLQIADAANIELVRQPCRRMPFGGSRLAVDLVIWNEDHQATRQQLQGTDHRAHRCRNRNPHVVDRPGGIFVRMRSR
jgi:cellobiose phosphorylase